MDSASDRRRGGVGAGILGWFGRLVRDRRGNIAAMTALLIVPLAGILGMAIEGSGWLLVYRATQNAADSAVVAAATTAGNGGLNYAGEGKSVASNYGFTDGSNNTTVSVPAPTTYASVTPCAATPCYRVTITKSVPIFLLRAVGYSGTNGNGLQTITATALASLKTVDAPFCMLAVGSASAGKKGSSILTNGSPAANLGCNIMSNGNSTCNGHSVTSGFSDTVGTDDGSVQCGAKVQENQPPQSDPYAGLASDIPTNSCSSYYPETNANWPSGSNTLSGTVIMPAVQIYCGDVKLAANTYVTSASPGSVMVIENGQLDLNGYTLQSLAGSGLTIVFTSPQGAMESYTSGGTPTNFICNNSSCGSGQSGAGPNGVLDISSPTSGTWSGMAIFQDPNLPVQGNTQCTGNDPWSYTGNKPTWDISGIVDLSVTKFCVSGAINKSTNGYNCLTLVTYTTTINGTGNLIYQNPQSQCAQQGVQQIMEAAYVIGQLEY